MGHKIIEAIIEDGQIKYIDKKLPGGRLKVHIIYDTAEKKRKEKGILKLVTETSAIYKEINAESEAKLLRTEWDRNVSN